MPNALEAFSRLLEKPEAELPLSDAALLIAHTEYKGLDPAPHLHQLEEMGRAVAARAAAARDPYSVIEALNAHLFGELGFRGNRENYYDPRNSFLNDVLERRTGIPITLSVVYLDVAQRAGLPLQGIGLPGHFIVGYGKAERQLFIDPFNGGLVLTREDCCTRLKELYGDEIELEDTHLEPVSKRTLLFRMLNNLRAIYIQQQSWEKTLTILAWLAVVEPAEPSLRRDRGLVRAKLQHYTDAVADLHAYLQLAPEAADAEQIRETLAALAHYRARIN